MGQTNVNQTVGAHTMRDPLSRSCTGDIYQHRGATAACFQDLPFPPFFSYCPLSPLSHSYHFSLISHSGQPLLQSRSRFFQETLLVDPFFAWACLERHCLLRSIARRRRPPISWPDPGGAQASPTARQETRNEKQTSGGRDLCSRLQRERESVVVVVRRTKVITGRTSFPFPQTWPRNPFSLQASSATEHSETNTEKHMSG